jgi:tRNA dimethylallyltransferase
VPIIPVASAACIVLEIEKDILNINIEHRFHKMLEKGALDEVRVFTDWDSPAAQVIGAAELRRHIAGEVSLPQATVSAVTATRQFAKRQRTWFRGKMEGWERMDVRTALDAVARS